MSSGNYRSDAHTRPPPIAKKTIGASTHVVRLHAELPDYRQETIFEVVLILIGPAKTFHKSCIHALVVQQCSVEGDVWTCRTAGCPIGQSKKRLEAVRDRIGQAERIARTSTGVLRRTARKKSCWRACSHSDGVDAEHKRSPRKTQAVCEGDGRTSQAESEREAVTPPSGRDRRDHRGRSSGPHFRTDASAGRKENIHSRRRDPSQLDHAPSP